MCLSETSGWRDLKKNRRLPLQNNSFSRPECTISSACQSMRFVAKNNGHEMIFQTINNILKYSGEYIVQTSGGFYSVSINEYTQQSPLGAQTRMA